ncbi:MAG: hypothetical protein ABF575_00420 [Liquorilactobacillus hordei]|uniref:hypothetical protein n=1 Tax=Liquorilactobacillus hordei TaxID=468911 RepID=UPI0039E93B2D
MKKAIDEKLYFEMADKIIHTERWQEKNKEFSNEMLQQYIKLHAVDSAQLSSEQKADLLMLRTLCENIGYAIAPSIIAVTMGVIAETGITSLRPMTDEETKEFKTYTDTDK